jgi:hypothetical protein
VREADHDRLLLRAGRAAAEGPHPRVPDGHSRSRRAIHEHLRRVRLDLPALIAAKKDAPARYGTVAGRVGSTQLYGAVLAKGSPLRPAIDEAIASLRREGTFNRIGARHFGAALASTPAIR